MFSSTFVKCFIPLVLLFSSLSEAVRVGDRLDYVLNTDRDRTSRMVREGEATTLISDYKNGAYTMTVNYDITIRPNRNKSGDITIDIPERVFAEGFYDELENAGTIKFEYFSVKYLGTSDATDADQNTYEDCHNIKLFDIDMDKFDPDGMNMMIDIKDLEIGMKVCNGVPGNGAAQLDVSGKVFGISVEMGFDFTTGN